MNVKRNSIEPVTTMRSIPQGSWLVGRVAYDVPVWIVRPKYAARPPRAQSWVGRRADDPAGEFWETLSYGLIWLCGLVGIVFVFFK